MTFDRIEIVMSPDGADAMTRALHRAHVWGVYSPQNHAAFSSTPPGDYSWSLMSEGYAYSLADVVEVAIEHHGEVARVAVVGYDDEAGADACLREFGYERDLDATGLEYRLAMDGAKL